MLLAIGSRVQTYLDFENVALSAMMGFAFNIEFADVSDERWFSQSDYSEAKHAFRPPT